MPQGRFTAKQVADLLVGTDSDVPANADDGRDFHLDAETVTCKMTLVEMRWCPSLM